MDWHSFLQKAIQRVQLLQNITGSVLSIVLVAEPLEAQSVFLQSPHLEPSCLCDHCTCDPGMFDPDHAAFFPGIFV